MHKFKAYRTFNDDNTVKSRFVDMTLDELDPGEVVVKTKYSTINYKDALSYNGAGKIMRKYPTNGGIDMAGTVESSTDPRWKRGDKVIVHAYDVGVAHDGGYSDTFAFPRIGSCGARHNAFDAWFWARRASRRRAIMLMEHNGLKPANGPVAVTGATGGVGSVAIEILAKSGYEVVAITGKKEETHYLRNLGAKEVLARESIDLTKIRPLEKATWAGAVDNLGGDLLANAGDVRSAAPWRDRSRRRHGSTPPLPFIHAGAPARTAPIVRCRCARRSGTSSPSNGAPMWSTTRFVPSTSPTCRRTSMPT